MNPLISLLYGAFLISLMASTQAQENKPSQTPPATPTPSSEPRVKFIDLQNLNEKTATSTDSGFVMIEGATYLVFGDTLMPMPGGGASGCFDKDAEAKAARLARARAAYAQQLKLKKD
jgi:hypothetical protein